VPRLMTLVSKVFSSRTYTSTQEQAWLLLAARALAEDARAMQLMVGTTPHRGPLSRGIGLDELAAGPLVIENQGDGEVASLLSVRGASLTAEPAVERGFSIERSYYTLDGQKVELKSATGGTSSVKQNDRLVVVVKVTLKEKEKGGRILLVDRLPAGLEIENARLVDSGSVKSLDWLKRTVEPTHTEFRDDRFVAAFDVFRRGRRSEEGDAKAPDTLVVAYIVRAVTPGTFTHPAATVEDMYQPERLARTAAGRLTVTEGK
ncbi:MAG TPA: alpha-2-macroglobulin family protein, partial [Hyphomicrobiaceae bacterium]|nr:alpha-2-macroglobulin family protein [Hyphomicrobiaceae bacterium]